MAKKKRTRKKKTGKKDWRSLPRKDPEKVRDKRVLVNLSETELSDLRQAAEDADESISSYVRRALLARLRRKH